MKTIHFTLFAAITLLIFAACDNTEKPDDNNPPIDDTPVQSVIEMVQGKWESVLVTRSQKAMDTDTAQFFIEIKDSTFTSNIFDENQNTPYENGVNASIENGEIYFDELDEIFFISDISATSLALETRIKGFVFEFHFMKSK